MIVLKKVQKKFTKMQKFEMEKQKISYEISGESHVCFSEIGISTENQVSNITEKRENERENCL